MEPEAPQQATVFFMMVAGSSIWKAANPGPCSGHYSLSAVVIEVQPFFWKEEEEKNYYHFPDKLKGNE